jgi:LysR family transcriptional regulator, nod-box dependent transcriptional activator
LAGPVREMLLQGEAIIKKNMGFRPESSNRTFRVNMSDYAASVVMNNAWRKIQQVAPGIRLEITSIIEEPTVEYLERGYLDVAISPAEQISPLHPSDHLFDDHYVCLVWSGNKLIGDRLTVEKYLSLGHIAARFGKAQNRSFNEVFLARAGHQLRVEAVVPFFSMQPTLLVGTNLIATVQERFAKFYAQHLPLKILPMPIPLPPLQMNIQWHRYHNHDAGTKWLCQILREAAQEDAK